MKCFPVFLSRWRVSVNFSLQILRQIHSWVWAILAHKSSFSILKSHSSRLVFGSVLAKVVACSSMSALICGQNFDDVICAPVEWPVSLVHNSGPTKNLGLSSTEVNSGAVWTPSGPETAPKQTFVSSASGRNFIYLLNFIWFVWNCS